MNTEPIRCERCGKFMQIKTGASWAMRYSGYPPCPDHEDFRCKECVDNHGPLFAQAHIRQDEAGVFTADEIH